MGIFSRIKKEKTIKDQKVVTQIQEATVAKSEKPLKKDDSKKSASAKLGVFGAEIILKPLVTEKSATLAAENKYVFVVRKNASRVQIRSAIKAIYGIIPVSVNVQNMQGKSVRFGRMRGKRQDWKKAIVTLPQGKTISVYDGV